MCVLCAPMVGLSLQPLPARRHLGFQYFIFKISVSSYLFERERWEKRFFSPVVHSFNPSKSWSWARPKQQLGLSRGWQDLIVQVTTGCRQQESALAGVTTALRLPWTETAGRDFCDGQKVTGKDHTGLWFSILITCVCRQGLNGTRVMPPPCLFTEGVPSSLPTWACMPAPCIPDSLSEEWATVEA